jgi:hypothetical protein
MRLTGYEADFRRFGGNLPERKFCAAYQQKNNLLPIADN